MPLFAPPRRFRPDDIVISSLGSWQSDAQDLVGMGAAVLSQPGTFGHTGDAMAFSTAYGVPFEIARPTKLEEFWHIVDGGASVFRMTSFAVYDDTGALVFQTDPVIEGKANAFGQAADVSGVTQQQYDLETVLPPGRYVMAHRPGANNGMIASTASAVLLRCQGCAAMTTINPTLNVTATARGAGQDKTPGTSFGFSPASNFAAGSLAVLGVVVDNSTTGGTTTPVTTVTDGQGNIWVKSTTPSGVLDPGLVNEGLCLEWWECYPSALGTGDTITVTMSTSTTAKAWCLWELTSPAGTTPVRYDNWEFGSGTSTSITTGTIGGNVRQKGDALVCIGGAEGTGTFTGDSDTTGGSWSSGQTAATAGSTADTNMAVYSQAKTISDRSAQSWTVTISTSEDWVRGFAFYTAAHTSMTLRGNGNNKAAGSTYGFSPTSNFTALASMGVLLIAADAISGNTTVTSVTDTNGNTWTQRHFGSSGSSATDIYSGMYTTQFDGGVLDTGDTITITFSGSVTAKAYQLWEVASPTYRPQWWAGNNSGSPTGTALASGNGPNGFPPQVIGWAAVKAPVTVTTPDSDNANGGPWGPVQLDKTTGGADNTNVAIISQRKVVYSFSDTAGYDITTSISAAWQAWYTTIGGDAHTFPATATWIACPDAFMPLFGLSGRVLV